MMALAPLGPLASPGSTPSLIDPTDVVALVVMALFTIRRIELKGTDPRAFPGVARADFDAWFGSAVFAKSLAVNACFLKFVLNNVWFYAFRGRVPLRVLAVGGLAVFFGWLLVLAYSTWLASRAKARGDALGIVVGRRLVEAPLPPPSVSEEQPAGTGEESSR